MVTFTVTTRRCYVYAIEDQRKRIKLGYSKHPYIRLLQLQTGNSDVLILKYQRGFITCKKAHSVENTLHAIFAARRKQGEWFDLNDQEKQLLEKIFTLQNISDTERLSLQRLGLLTD